MSLINSVNIQMENGQEILLCFSKPHTTKQAMIRAKETIFQEKTFPVTSVSRNPAEHGKNLWIAYHGMQLLGWIMLNEQTK